MSEQAASVKVRVQQVGGSSVGRRPGRRVEVSPLESRTHFDAVYPTANEQYLLELINRARANPTAEVALTASNNAWNTGVTPDLNEGLPASTISTDPKQPLAMNPNLLDAARKHTAYLFANPSADAHIEVVNGQSIDPTQRDIAAGYPVPTDSSENVWTSLGIVGSDNILNDLTALEQGPFVDGVNGGTPGRGHRLNLMDPGANEVGLGLGVSTSGNIITNIATQDFGNAGQTSFLCGIAYNDLNNDNFYEPGEELANVTITATRITDSAVFTTTTWTSGGYSLALTPGTYTVTASGGSVGTPAAQTVTITNQNVEADFLGTSAPAGAVPTVALQPANQTVPPLGTATFTAASNGSPTPTVQWLAASAGSNSFSPVPGATGLSLTVTGYVNFTGNQYEAVFTNNRGTVTTAPATLSVVDTSVTITTYPTNQTVNAGDTVTFTTAGTGYTNIQWSTSTDGTNYTPVPGGTNPTLTFVASAAQSATIYQVVYSSATGSAFLVVNAAPTTPTVTAQPQNQTAQDGTATLNVLAEGYPTPTIQWQSETPGAGATFQNVFGATSPSLTVEAPTNGKVERYRAILTNGNGSVTSRTATVAGNLRSPASNDLTNLQTAAQTTLAAIEGCKQSTIAAQNKLQADLVRLKASTPAKTALKTLVADETAARATFTKNESKFLGGLIHLTSKAYVDWLHSTKQPSNTTLSTQLQTDLSALQTTANSSTAPADATACKVATLDQLAPISAVSPTDARLQADVLAAQTNAHNISQALQAPVTIAQDIVSQIQADMASK